MKKLVLCLLAVWGIGVSPVLGNALRVGVYDNPPQIFMNEDGKAEGIFIDFLEDVAAKEGWDLEYKQGSFSDLMILVESGGLDLLPSVAISYERLKRFSMTRQALLKNWGVIYRRHDVVVNNVFDLEGRRIVGLRDGIHLKALESLVARYEITCSITGLDSYDDAMKSLEDGTGDVAVVNRTFSTRVGGQYDAVSSLFSFNPIPLHFAVTRGSHHEVIHALDRELALQLASPSSTLQQSLNHWMKPEQIFAIPTWVYALSLGSLLGVLALLGLNFVLRRMVRSRTMELEAQKSKTLEALRSQKLFFGTLNHEIRTPLNHIVGMEQVLRGQFEKEGRAFEPLDVIRKGSDRMAGLLESLLRFADIDRNAFNLKERPTKLCQLIETTFETAKAFPIADEVELKKVIDVDEELTVSVDGDAIGRISLNLLHNATKYTANGYIEFRASARRAGDYVSLELEIADTGKGIPEADLEEIRKPFQRGTTTDYVEEGSGLGLSIVERLLHLMQGSLDIESELGKGSSFRVSVAMQVRDLSSV